MTTTLFLGAVLWTSLGQASASAPSAVVAKLYVLTDGEVTVSTPARGERPVRLMVELEEGSTVTVGPTAKPRITFLKTGIRAQLAPNSKVKIVGNRITLLKGGKPTDLPKIPVRIAQHGTGATVSRPAATLARGDKLEISLIGGFRSIPEELRWRSVEGAASYRISIKEADERIVSVFYSDGDKTTLPTDALKIKRGLNYEIAIEALNAEAATIKTGSAFFRILTEDEVKDLNQLESKSGLLDLDDPGELLVLADLYEEFMLDSDALGMYRKLNVTKPRNEQIDAAIERIEKGRIPPALKSKDKPNGSRSGGKR